MNLETADGATLPRGNRKAAIAGVAACVGASSADLPPD
jgi:hypothetical protein